GFFKTRFVSGIFLIVPLVVTVMVLEFLFDLTVGKVKPFISMLPFAVPVWAQSIVAALLLLAVLWMVGRYFPCSSSRNCSRVLRRRCFGCP
ncbi:MAG TPA: hypothetical protein PLX03_12285, partial [Candidatus Hydrogenedentes bacterium]|nr:hypothetical protein [Candidatus Hydrogenedentota bacterium]